MILARRDVVTGESPQDMKEKGAPEPDLLVETYSSFAYAVEPRAYVLDGVRHNIQSILRMWRTPDGIHFYVQDQRDEFAELIYHEHRGVWIVREFGKTCAREI